MNALWISFVCGLVGYLIGSIPFGYLIVKAVTGKDIRTFGSGRTGGTNAFRAAGLVAGFATAIMDVVKGLATVLVIERLALGTNGLAEALGGR